MSDPIAIVRSFYDLLGRWMEAYRANPGSIENSPVFEEVLGRLTEDVEWDWHLSPEVFSGRDGIIQALADWLDAIEDWDAWLGEVIHAGGDRVFGVLHVTGRGKGSGVPIDQSIYSVYTVRDDKMARFKDFSTREEALDEMGLSAEERTNLDVIVRGMAAFNTGDIDTLLEACDPEIELTTSLVGMLEGVTYRGHDGYRQWIEQQAETYTRVHFEPRDIRLFEDTVLVVFRTSIRAALSGIEMQDTRAAVFKLRSALLVTQVGYDDPAEAMQAVGLDATNPSPRSFD